MKIYKQNETPEFEMIRAAAPEDEGARQYYFIEQARILWTQQVDGLVDSGEAAARYEGSLLSELQAEGKYGTFHIATFGCQMKLTSGSFLFLLKMASQDFSCGAAFLQ